MEGSGRCWRVVHNADACVSIDAFFVVVFADYVGDIELRGSRSPRLHRVGGLREASRVDLGDGDTVSENTQAAQGWSTRHHGRRVFAKLHQRRNKERGGLEHSAIFMSISVKRTKKRTDI